MDPTNVNVVYAAFGNSKSASTGMYLSSTLSLIFNLNYIVVCICFGLFVFIFFV